MEAGEWGGMTQESPIDRHEFHWARRTRRRSVSGHIYPDSIRADRSERVETIRPREYPLERRAARATVEFER